MVIRRIISSLILIGDLVKYRLSLAVAFSSVTGWFICSGDVSRDLLAVAAGVFALSAGSASLNQITERKTDALMERTSSRPLPSGKMKTGTAIAVSASFLAAGIIITSAGGYIPLLLGILNVVLYNVIYTGLKKKTVMAIIPGALVGAIPPVIGYTYAGGHPAEAGILLFSLFMYLWQLPHFWLLLIRYRNEYRRAGIKTIPATLNNRQLGNLVFAWVCVSSALLYILSGYLISPILPGKIILLLLNITFILLFYKALYKTVEDHKVRNAFMLLNTYSALVMVLVIISSVM